MTNASLCYIFVCFIISRTIYKYIFKIATIVVSGDYSKLIPTILVSGVGLRVCIWKKKTKQNETLWFRLMQRPYFGCGPGTTMWVNCWPHLILWIKHAFLLALYMSHSPPLFSFCVFVLCPFKFYSFFFSLTFDCFL